MIKRIISVCACLIVLSIVQIGMALNASSGEIKLGEWNSRFKAGKAYAEQNHIPMVVFWASPGCYYCGLLEAVCEGSDFIAWQSKQKIVMIFALGKDTSDGNAAYNFSRGTSDYPFIAVYWPKADGTTLYTHFSGRYNHATMPSRQGATLLAQFTTSIELLLAAYNPNSYNGGNFVVSNTPNAHLEADISSTTNIDVVLARTSSGVSTNYLVTSFPGQISVTNRIDWETNDTNKTVKVTVPSGLSTGDSTQAALVLADSTGAGVATNAIWLVDNPANSPANPLWLGERTASTLKAGEWTMDLDAATNRTAAQSGAAYTLVNFAGVLWCPWCVGLEADVLTSAEFAAWSTNRNVSLVVCDNPRRDDSAPSLLRWDVGSGRLLEDRYTKVPVSGAAYLSRKMISDADAAAMLARNHTLGYETWNLPGKARIGYPTLVLLRKDGTIVGRVAIEDNEAYTFDVAQVIQRMDELITLDADSTEEKNGDLATTTLGIGPAETITTQSLQASDLVDVWKLTNIVAGVNTKVIISGTTAADMTCALIQVSGGTTNTFATVAGDIATNIVVTAAVTNAGDCFVKVAGNSATTFAPSNSASTIRGYTVTTSFVLLPQEAKATMDLSAGSVAVEVVSNALYKFTVNNGTLSAGAGLTNVGSGLYRAGKSGETTLTLSAAATLSYQVWNPGEVVFATTTQRVIENAGSATVSVTRQGGGSDSCTVTVMLDTSASSATNGARYNWTDTNLTWADGETGTKTVTFTLNKNAVFEGEQRFVLKLLPASDYLGTCDTNQTDTVTIFDTDDPVLGSESYSLSLFKYIAVAKSYPVYNLKGGSVTMKRISGTLPSGVNVKYDKASGAVVVSGTPSRTGSYTASYAISERRSGGTATGTVTTFSFTVADGADLNPQFGVALKFQNAPLFATIGGTNVLVGLIDINASKTGKVTARYSGTSRSTVSFSGAWTDLDETTGTLSASLANKSGMSLEIALGTNGTGAVTLNDPSSSTGALTAPISVSPWSNANPATDYVGTYTVTFPVVVSAIDDPDALTTEPSVAANGTAFLALSMTDSAARKGTVRYTGLLPNGVTIGGSAVLQPCEGGTNALLTVFKRSSRDVFGVALMIRANAATTYQNNPEVVLAAPGSLGCWTHTESAGTYSFRRGMAVYGGYYSPDMLLSTCCAATYETTTMSFVVGTNAASEAYGDISDRPAPTLTVQDSKLVLDAKPSGFSLSFNKKTGVYGGSFYLTFGNGQRIRASYKGIVLPGWWDCGCTEQAVTHRPFGSGACWYADKVDGRSVKRGTSVDLSPKK